MRVRVGKQRLAFEGVSIASRWVSSSAPPHIACRRRQPADVVRPGPLPNLAGCSSARSLATSSRLCDATKPAAPLTPYEKDNARVLAAIAAQVQRFNTALKGIAEVGL